jgi:hypothetical protein
MPERKVILKNVGSVPFQATMYHDIVCARREICTCKTIYPGGGKRPPMRNPASFRINVGEKSEQLPAAVLLIPQVKTALRRDPPHLILLSERAEVEKL